LQVFVVAERYTQLLPAVGVQPEVDQSEAEQVRVAEDLAVQTMSQWSVLARNPRELGVSCLLRGLLVFFLILGWLLL
jgi:hypothetical protein